MEIQKNGLYLFSLKSNQSNSFSEIRVMPVMNATVLDTKQKGKKILFQHFNELLIVHYMVSSSTEPIREVMLTTRASVVSN